MDEERWPTSLKALFRAALRDFPGHEEDIRHYVGELSHVMSPHNAVASSAEASGAEAADATCTLTGDDPVTLLFKFEEFLESLLVEDDRNGTRRRG